MNVPCKVCVTFPHSTSFHLLSVSSPFLLSRILMFLHLPAGSIFPAVRAAFETQGVFSPAPAWLWSGRISSTRLGTPGGPRPRACCCSTRFKVVLSACRDFLSNPKLFKHNIHLMFCYCDITGHISGYWILWCPLYLDAPYKLPTSWVSFVKRIKLTGTTFNIFQN